ncbi:hypothetical protein [Arthrobacter sp. A2-55]|uniref:hypothetical protein n=1 Tax=Arthrobacter sp. A2-55 TaxID=2897337 RepID=UPI0021CDAC52|nr:hypothetical protein [Arthrobacter sp. A2-55]MCU6479069.1 hypothetical protein [Arthrobacter sp. A2-55]
MNVSKYVGSVLVELQVHSVPTDHPQCPSYLTVRGANIISSTMNPWQLKALQADNRNEGIIGFENGCVDAAMDDYLDISPTDPRIAILEKLLQGAIAPNMNAAAFHDDAVDWLAQIDHVSTGQ